MPARPSHFARPYRDACDEPSNRIRQSGGDVLGAIQLLDGAVGAWDRALEVYQTKGSNLWEWLPMLRWCTMPEKDEDQCHA